MAYQALDFYDFDSLLEEEERAVRDEVRRWVDERFMPLVSDCFIEQRFPLELARELGEMNLFGATLTGYGCAGMNNRVYGLINRELERGDSGLRSFLSVQSGLVMYPIWAYGSEEQKQQWLPRLAAGTAIGCFGLTEPDHGSDPGGMITHAEDHGDHYLLNGAKMWITNGSIADVAVVWARLGGSDGPVRGFLVEKGMPGFSAPLHKKKFSLCASITSELVFDHVKLPKENILPGVSGLKGPLSCLNQARYGIAWGVIGAAQACYDEALQYQKERRQFGRPLASFQLQQAKLAEMMTDITAAQGLALQLAQLKDSGRITAAQISLAKRNNVFMALRTARAARTMLGANGISLEYQCGRHMLNLESVYTYEGTHDIHTLVLGQAATGIAAYSNYSE
ncbi:MAG: acyl-CoA dehydrogenase family protein [Candidatus Delongbacteria bacterium]|nr:acyl-CoA dehydrogenase family protein [Candidatus Cloacimonadota bacterium]MCA9785037.1 acyl-CoA dehydrogenase family protein [Candidatus Cloacimonadota bacterium]MCB9474946.1 acyl-CoA dehydrogenase family protein [Candidatus Delongbacteria bacterium]